MTRLVSSSKPRPLIVAGNWKMNLTVSETREYFGKLQELFRKDGPTHVRAQLYVPYLNLVPALECSAGMQLAIGSQNAHWESQGAFTGEISGPMLKEAGIHWVLVGHSERRLYFGETDQTVCKRALHLLKLGMSVIFCLGETRAEREFQQTEAVLKRQLEIGLATDAGADSFAPYLNGRLVFAYEPVWAIGTGLTASPGQAEVAHRWIRKWLWDRFGREATSQTSLLYGGSVTPENFKSLLECPNVDGGLVGGASLKPESFSALLKIAEAC